MYPSISPKSFKIIGIWTGILLIIILIFSFVRLYKPPKVQLGYEIFIGALIKDLKRLLSSAINKDNQFYSITFGKSCQSFVDNKKLWTQIYEKLAEKQTTYEKLAAFLSMNVGWWNEIDETGVLTQIDRIVHLLPVNQYTPINTTFIDYTIDVRGSIHDNNLLPIDDHTIVQFCVDMALINNDDYIMIFTNNDSSVKVFWEEICEITVQKITNISRIMRNKFDINKHNGLQSFFRAILSYSKRFTETYNQFELSERSAILVYNWFIYMENKEIMELEYKQTSIRTGKDLIKKMQKCYRRLYKYLTGKS